MLMSKKNLENELIEVDAPLSDASSIYYGITGKERPTMKISAKEFNKQIKTQLFICALFPLMLVTADLLETKSIVETYKRFANGAYAAVASEQAGPTFEFPYKIER